MTSDSYFIKMNYSIPISVSDHDSVQYFWSSRQGGHWTISFLGRGSSIEKSGRPLRALDVLPFDVLESYTVMVVAPS